MGAARNESGVERALIMPGSSCVTGHDPGSCSCHCERLSPVIKASASSPSNTLFIQMQLLSPPGGAVQGCENRLGDKGEPIDQRTASHDAHSDSTRLWRLQLYN